MRSSSVKACGALRLPVVSLVAGFASLSAVWLTARMLAPFYGLGPFLGSALVVVALVAMALGAAVSHQPSPGRVRPWTAFALAGSGAWLLLAIWFRRPLLQLLEPVGVRADVAIAVVVLLAPPLFLLATVVPRALNEDPEPARSAARALSACALGAAGAALLVPYALLPLLGLPLTTLLVGLLLIATAALAAGGRTNEGRALLGLLALAATLGLVGPRAQLPPGVTEQAVRGFTDARVVERDGSRYLVVDGSIHAVVEPENLIGLRRPEAVLGVVQLLHPTPGRALVLGLRGGALAKQLSWTGWSVDVVEPDTVTIRLATRHFGLRPHEGRVIVAEPRAHLRRGSDRYDLVVFDNFASSFVPPEMVSRECLAEARRRLEPGGTFAIVVESAGWDDPLVRALWATARSVFDAAWVLPTGEPPNALGSVVVLAGDRSFEVPDANLPQPAEFLGNPLEHWNAVQLVHAWSNRFEPERRGAVILTDDRSPAELWGERINRVARQELHAYFGNDGTSW